MNTPARRLDPAFLACQRQRLMNDRDTLSESLRRGEEDRRIIEQASHDQANEPEDRAQDLSIEENALVKIDEGTYGLSDVSGKAIPKARLEAFPESIRTITEEKQRTREMRALHAIKPSLSS
jgi:DnaK suppressor protein